MKKIRINFKLMFWFFFNLLVNLVLLFYQIINPILICCILIIYNIFNYVYLNRYENSHEKIVSLMILSIPTSFISIIGTSYSVVPITWFIIYELFLLIKLLLYNQFYVKKSQIIIIFSFIIIFLFSLYFSPNFLDSFKQFSTILLILLAFPIGYSLRNKIRCEYLYNFFSIYILAVIIFCTQIIMQYIYISKTGKIIGTYVEYPNRTAFAGIFGDYSFATVYIASAAILVLVLYFSKFKIVKHLISLCILELFFYYVIFLVSSRTGLYALLICQFIFLYTRVKKLNIFSILLVLILILFVPEIIKILNEIRGGQNLLDNSNRLPDYYRAINTFRQKFIFGTGFGISNLEEVYGIGVPHNFIIQYLVQFGIIGFTIIVSNFILSYKKLTYINEIKWVLILIGISSMVIPDIFSSRFLNVIIIIALSMSHIQTNNIRKIS